MLRIVKEFFFIEVMANKFADNTLECNVHSTWLIFFYLNDIDSILVLISLMAFVINFLIH